MACYTGKLEIKTTDPRINYNLLPGEKLMTCPYNLSHAVLPIKFHRHVNNCHRLHCKDQQKKGEPVKFAICQHDRSHHVPKELLANHEATCEARLDNDDGKGWGSDEEAGAAGGSSAGASAGPPGGWKVTLREPPELSKEALAAIHTEDWDLEPEYKPKFDPEERIHELRSGGYNVIKTHCIVGLTKSEKKEFYAKEDDAAKSYERQGFYERLRRDGPQSGTTTETESMYGEDQSCYEIRE